MPGPNWIRPPSGMSRNWRVVLLPLSFLFNDGWGRLWLGARHDRSSAPGIRLSAASGSRMAALSALLCCAACHRTFFFFLSIVCHRTELGTSFQRWCQGRCCFDSQMVMLPSNCVPSRLAVTFFLNILCFSRDATWPKTRDKKLCHHKALEVKLGTC
jgi:hypothetical protein